MENVVAEMNSAHSHFILLKKREGLNRHYAIRDSTLIFETYVNAKKVYLKASKQVLFGLLRFIGGKITL